MKKKVILYIIVLIISIVSVIASQYFNWFIPILFVFILLFTWIILFTRVFIFNNKTVKTEEVTTIKPEIVPGSKKEFNQNDFHAQITKLALETGKLQYFKSLFNFLSGEIDAYQGVVFMKEPDTGNFVCIYQYACFSENIPENFVEGEGVHGQVVLSKKILLLDNLSDRLIVSGLGNIKPYCIAIIPLMSNETVLGIMELSFANEISSYQNAAMNFLMQNLFDNIKV